MLCQAGHYCVPLTIDRTSRRHQLIHAVAVIGWVQRQFPGQIARHIIRQVSEDNIKEEREQAKKEIVGFNKKPTQESLFYHDCRIKRILPQPIFKSLSNNTLHY